MLLCTRLARYCGSVLYPATSRLPTDFYHCCEHVFGIRLHEETYIGERSSQIRGLFLGTARQGPLARNKIIATIPLAKLYTEKSIHKKPNALHTLSVEKVRDAIEDEEFKLMAPHFYMGMQLAAMTTSLPDISAVKDAEQYRRIAAVLRDGANPWIRILDDEDFNDKFVFSMFGMTLDKWQRENYSQLIHKFNSSSSFIHEKLRPPFKLEHLRRMTRLVMARLEHMPPSGYYEGSAWLRRWQRRFRRLRGERDPTELTMVPLLDLVNHSNRPNCGVRVGPSRALGGQGAITLFTLCPIAPGEEICRHYNFAISRANALFRYGFLPFDLISIVEHDAVQEHFVRRRPEMKAMADGEIEKMEAEAREIERLEKLFQKARHGA